MKASRILGIGIAVVGLLITLVPLWIFPTCVAQIHTADGGSVPMKCFWTGRAEIGIGILIFFGGIVIALARSADIRLGANIMTLLAAALAASVPLFLIGGCMMPTMTCRITTFPAIYLLSAIAIILSAICFFALRGRRVMTEERAA
jgi:hypothetical protein